MTISQFEDAFKAFYQGSEVLYPGNTPVQFIVKEDESVIWELEEKMRLEEIKLVDGKITFYFRIYEQDYSKSTA